jgi:hypothetical protein
MCRNAIRHDTSNSSDQISRPIRSPRRRWWMGPRMRGAVTRRGVRCVVIGCGERSARQCGLGVAAAARPGVGGRADGRRCFAGRGALTRLGAAPSPSEVIRWFAVCYSPAIPGVCMHALLAPVGETSSLLVALHDTK